MKRIRHPFATAATLLVVLCWAFAAPAQTETGASASDDGTVFGSMTVEGENRIRITFERPALEVDIDPENAPGLQWGSAADVLTRSEPELLPPLLQASTHQPARYLMRPWLRTLKRGALARFRPEVENVNNWRLTVVDTRGREVVSFADKGDPPDGLAWDGRTDGGGLAWPGVTYSYVFEAYDRAGNKSRIVGEGFTIPPYAVGDGTDMRMLFAGQHLKETAKVGRGGKGDPVLLLEVAGLINQVSGPGTPVIIEASARNHGTAETLGGKVKATLEQLLIGDPARIAVTTLVADDGPVDGAVEIKVAAGS